ncbi:Hint domain-containing protein [Bordetella tumulicola]|uniref:Hint domain-containing protein n=1 Tax=Bordetella tumulicola TaxID=1649133 RepID=UPI0039EEE0F9
MTGSSQVMVDGVDVIVNAIIECPDSCTNSIVALNGADVVIGPTMGARVDTSMTYRIDGASSLTYGNQDSRTSDFDNVDFEFTGDAGGTLKLILPNDPAVDVPVISIRGLRIGDRIIAEMNDPDGGGNFLPVDMKYDENGLLGVGYAIDGLPLEVNGPTVKFVKFQIDGDVPAGTVLSVYDNGLISYACYLRGTHIATPDGESKVEALRAGDKVLTASGQVATVKWLGYRKLTASRIPAKDALKAFPITFHKDAIADNVPHRDLTISPHHHLYFDGKLIPAMALVNGKTITQDLSRQSFEYFHVELDHFDILLAEGVAAESYVDTGNRSMFQNVNPTSMLADFGPAPGRQSIAGMKIVRKGPVVEALRERLRLRAEAITFVAQSVVQRRVA